MKISDIVFEQEDKSTAHEKRAIAVTGGDPYDVEAYMMFFDAGGGNMPNAPEGWNWVTLGKAARQHPKYGPGSGTASTDSAIKAVLRGDDGNSDNTKPEKTSTTRDTERFRKDKIGRRLQHDRYYRDKDDEKKPKEIDWDSPTVFDLPDDHFDFIPGVKTVKKAAKVGKSAATKVRRAADKAKRLQNFSDKSRKKR